MSALGSALHYQVTKALKPSQRIEIFMESEGYKSPAEICGKDLAVNMGKRFIKRGKQSHIFTIEQIRPENDMTQSLIMRESMSMSPVNLS